MITTTFEKPIATRLYSKHPDDAHLKVVLHKNFKGEYVTHIFNTCDGGFHNGHYFGNDLQAAAKDFNER